ncbi:hydrolase [Hyunsoonleella sp. 2307UL5-6]|uniref:hydrolase n=1 Tax=Hyunsoonleella sp. 2307UL5-6 TaxID=3384768 RepID=UPI0039BCB8F5
MKQRIFMYLFVFTLLLVVFQYASAKRIIEDRNIKLNTAKTKVKRLADSIKILNEEIIKQSHFNLERNEDAISYFEKDGYDVSALIPMIKDEIYSTNEVSGQHPVVPYASSEGRKILINTVKLLNHKWIVADFSDGEYWGEVFVTYFVNNDKTIEFNTVESFLYPFD